MKVSELQVQELERIIQKSINRALGKGSAIQEAIHDANERRKDAEYQEKSKPL